MNILKNKVFKSIFAILILAIMFGAGYGTAKVINQKEDDDTCAVLKQMEEESRQREKEHIECFKRGGIRVGFKTGTGNCSI